MEVIAAASGLCSVGCGAAVSALAGGPVLSAFSVVAAVGYGIYSLATGKESSDDIFEDAIEGDHPPDVPTVVKVARHHAKPDDEYSTQKSSRASFFI